LMHHMNLKFATYKGKMNLFIFVAVSGHEARLPMYPLFEVSSLT